MAECIAPNLPQNPIAMNTADFYMERPAIHVCVTSTGAPGGYRRVEIGAEEEGLPCQMISFEETDVVALAYMAAQSSRFGVGVAISATRVIIHERHMPMQLPVLDYALTPANSDVICRMAGCNAARLVIRMPLKFEDEEQAKLEQLQKLERQMAARSKKATAKPELPKPEQFKAAPVPPSSAEETVLIRAVAKAVAQLIKERG